MAKARTQKLKVFKTPIGFHDAYVAVPSRKAALEAWGAGTDLFSAKIAEEVTELDGEAATEALAKPGEVVRAKRVGGEEEEPRPSTRSGRTEKKKGSPSTGSGRTQKTKKEGESRIKSGVTKKTPKPKPKPKPSRAALDRAEAALAKIEEKQAAEQAELDREEVRLANRRRVVEKKQREAMEAAQTKRDEAERAYRKAMREWAN